MSDRFRDALTGAWKRIEERQWIYGRMGRVNPSGSVTFQVPGRKGFVYVRLRNAVGAQTTVPARNDGAVPHTANLPVRMKLEKGVYVIHSRTSRIDMNEEPDTPASGVWPHATTHQHSGTDEIATATPAANAIPKADSSGLLNAWIALGAIINSATSKTTPVDADELALSDSAASFSLKKLTWANLKATLKTYFDTLYATTTGWIKADGTIPLTAEWDIGEDMAIRAERLEARDIEGLRHEDDGGNLGVHVGDGGNVGLLTTAHASHEVYLRKDQNAPTSIVAYNDTAGTAASTEVRLINDIDLACLMGIYSSLTSTYKGIVASDAFLYATTNLRLMADEAGKVISFTVNGASSPQMQLSNTVLDLIVPIDANYGSASGSILSETEGTSATASVIVKAGAASAALNAYGASFATAGLGGNLAFGAIGGDFIVYTNGDIASGGTNSVQFRVGGYGANQERARLTHLGQLLIGVLSGGASRLGIQAGSSSNDAAVGGVLYVSTTQVGNVGTGEDDLASYSIPANTLAANNQSIWFEAWGTYPNNANSKRLRARFGTSGINVVHDNFLPVGDDGTWFMRGRIYRTGAATQKGVTSLTTESGALTQSNIGLNQTLSGAITIKITGEATSNNDIVLHSFIVGWDDANT